MVRRFDGGDPRGREQFLRGDAGGPGQVGGDLAAVPAVGRGELLQHLQHVDLAPPKFHRGRLEHPPAAQRAFAGRGAEHERLAPGADDVLRQEELRQHPLARVGPVGVEDRDDGLHVRRAEVQPGGQTVLDARSVGRRPQTDGQYAGRREVADGREFVPPADRVEGHAGQVDRRPLAPLDPPDRLAVVVQGADADRLRRAVRPVPGDGLLDAHRPGQHAPGDDGAVAGPGEGAIDRQAERQAVVVPRQFSADGGEGGAQLRQADASRGRRGDDVGRAEERAGDQVAHLQRPQFERRRIDGVALRQRDHAAPDAEQVQDFEVFARLRHDAVVGRDGEQREVEAGRPGDHVADEPLVPRHVHDAERLVAERQPGEADVDGDAAGALLREAVAIDAGERLDERSLAVVDVPGGAENPVARHRRPP